MKNSNKALLGEKVEQEQVLNQYELVTACSHLSIKGKGLYRSAIMSNRFVNGNAVKNKNKNKNIAILKRKQNKLGRGTLPRLSETTLKINTGHREKDGRCKRRILIFHPPLEQMFSPNKTSGCF